MEITLIGILVPAVVAVATTLLVEYIAKPRLEARKDRILEADRRRRAALRGVQRVPYLGGRLEALREAQDLSYGRERVQQIAPELGPLIESGIEDLEVSEDIRMCWFEAMAVVRLTVHLVEAGRIEVVRWETHSAALDVIGLVSDLLAAPRWRVVARRRLKAQIVAADQRREAAQEAESDAPEVPPKGPEQPSTIPSH